MDVHNYGAGFGMKETVTRYTFNRSFSHKSIESLILGTDRFNKYAADTIIYFPPNQPLIVDNIGRETDQYEWIQVEGNLYCLVCMLGKKELLALEDFSKFYKLK